MQLLVDNRAAINDISELGHDLSVVGESMGELDLEVKSCDGRPVRARVVLRYEDLARGANEEIEEKAAASGAVCFELPDLARPIFLLVLPTQPGFWGLYTEEIDDFAELTLQDLPDLDRPAWWLQCMGINSSDLSRGANIRIGIVDAGFTMCEELKHIELLWPLDDGHGGQTSSIGWNHGESVCRIIADRAANAATHLSVAPGAQLIFADASSETGNIDPNRAAAAVVRLAMENVDIINLSWGEPDPDEAVLDAIAVAGGLGVTIVAAAGNDSKDETYFPARLDECIGVSALGYDKWGPPETVVHQYRMKKKKIGSASGLGTVYAWADGTYGEGIDAIAPGVGILVQCSEGNLFDLSGTSFASPMVAGVLAVALATDAHYRVLPRAIARTQYVRQAFRSVCRSLGLGRRYEGFGLPNLGL